MSNIAFVCALLAWSVREFVKRILGVWVGVGLLRTDSFVLNLRLPQCSMYESGSERVNRMVAKVAACKQQLLQAQSGMLTAHTDAVQMGMLGFVNGLPEGVCACRFFKNLFDRSIGVLV